MSTSFDSLVSRKPGSPTHSFRSGGTSASASNMSETRDISRQTAQQARHSHRRAIQARKIVFLVLILLLILGGLSYAIYRVVSNDSDETESTKIKLEKDEKTSILIKTSSIFTKKDKSSIVHDTKKLLTSSKKEEQIFSTMHFTSKIRTTQPAMATESFSSQLQHTTIINAQKTETLYSSTDYTSSNIDDQNAPSASALSSKALSVDTTKTTNNNFPITTSIVGQAPSISQSSVANNNRPTSSPRLNFQITETSLNENTETTHHDQATITTHTLDKSKFSTVSKVDQISHTAEPTPEIQTTQSSNVAMQHIPTTTIESSSSPESPIATSLPSLPKDKTGMISTSIISEISQLLKHSLITQSSNQNSSPTIVVHSSSITNTLSSKVSKFEQNQFTTKTSEQKSSSANVIAPSESLNTFHIKYSSIANNETLSSSIAVSLENDQVSTSFQTTSSEIGNIYPTISANTHSSKFAVENTPNLNYSTVVMMISTNILPTISPTRNVMIPLNTSHTVERSQYLDTKNISTSNPLSSTIAMSENGSNPSTHIHAIDKATTQIQPTKTFTTPVVSSSVSIAPYYLAWSNWSTCSRDCGGGYTIQTRNCSKKDQCDLLGPSINTTICNFHKCNETTYDVSLNLTDYEWTDDLHNTTSKAYTDLVEQLMEELRALYGPNVSIKIEQISRGSVIVSFTITFSSSNHVNNLTNAIDEGKIGNLSVALVEIVNNMAPLEPDFILVQNTTTNSTLIHWSSIQPNETNGILLGYKVNLTPGNASWTLNDQETTTLNVVNLKPDTQYTINVLGFNINGDGIEKSTTFKTKELPPHFLSWGNWSNCSRDCGGGVKSRNRSCSKEGMCAHLGEYSQNEFCNVEKCNETSYEVGLNMTNVDWTDDLHNTSSAAYQELLAKFIAELRKKYPNATIDIGSISKGSVIFTFKITFPKESEPDDGSLANDLGNGLGNFTTDVKSIENKNLPRVPPGSINVTMVTHHSAVINWLPISEEDSNGAVIGYKIILTCGHNKTMKYNITAQASDIEIGYVLEMLAPNTTYRFYMYGYNINGEGAESEHFNFTTKVQIPKIGSANISQITTTDALFSWQRIKNNNFTYGNIAGYKIFITHNHQPRTDHEVASFEDEVHLKNLLPNTTYGVTVLGFNHYGDGVISDILNFTTKVKIPKVSSGNVSDIATTSCVFHWSKIPDSEDSYGIISGYKIIVIEENTPYGIMHNVTQNESKIELRELHPAAGYNITIIGFNGYGEGVSKIFGFRTRDLIPKPNSVSVTNITLTTAKLSWELVSSNNQSYGEIDGYRITVHNGAAINITVRDMASTVLQNLSSNSTYCFHVAAFNTFGEGLLSDIECFTTSVEEQDDELETSTLVILKPSQLSTAHVPHETEKLLSTTSKQVQNKTTEMIQQRSSVLIDNSVHEIRETTAKISVTTAVGDIATSTILMQHFSSSIVTSYNTHQEAQASSFTPSSQFTTLKTTITPSSQFTTLKTTITHATPSVFTSHVLPSSTVKEPIIQNSPTSWPLTKSSSYPTTSPTSKTTSLPTNLSTASQSTPSPEPTLDVEYIVGKIRLTDESFNSDLSNPETETFKTLATKYEKLLEDLFKADGLQFESIKVVGFTKGSVVVDFYVTTVKSMEYKTENFTIVLLQARANGGLEGQPFELSLSDFSTEQITPTKGMNNEGDAGLQKNEEDDDSAMIVAVVMCVLLVIGAVLVVFFIGKKKKWFNRSKRKVIPEDDDDDDDDLYPSPPQDTVRLKTAKGGRKSRGARINGGHSTTEC